VKGTTALKEAVTTAPRMPGRETAVQALLRWTDAPDASSPARHDIENSAATRRTKANTEAVIGLLNRALAIAISCILRYKRHYLMTTGIRSHRVTATFLQHVTEEQAHADQLAERIVQLGGKAVFPLEWLLNRNHAEHVEEDSLAEMITADLFAEQSAIHNYRAMIATIGSDDPKTRQVLERILVEEEAHAENLSGLVRG
jgi:bacterioferritin